MSATISAIEMCICYRIFRDEMKTSMKVAELTLSQIVSLVILIAILTSPLTSYISKGNAIIFGAVLLSIFWLVNKTSLLVCETK